MSLSACIFGEFKAEDMRRWVLSTLAAENCEEMRTRRRERKWREKVDAIVACLCAGSGGLVGDIYKINYA